MLHRMEALLGMSIVASDGELGTVKDVYFDDLHWAARYLEVDTGDWLEKRKVLISPISVDRIDWGNGEIHVRLTRRQVERSPSYDTHKPVYRQHEVGYFNYYGYPEYWSGDLMWGVTPYPFDPVVPARPIDRLNAEISGHSDFPKAAQDDPHLRSIREVTGYRLHAADGLIGHIEDFVIDEQTWALRYLVVDTVNWLPGKHVVIPPQWIQRIDWKLQQAYTEVTRDRVQQAPRYHADMDFTRGHETHLYAHYDRPGYW